MTSMPTLFDETEAANLWAEALESWKGQYSIGDAEKALRMEFRRHHKCHPADATPEQLKKFLVDVREGVIR